MMLIFSACELRDLAQPVRYPYLDKGASPELTGHSFTESLYRSTHHFQVLFKKRFLIEKMKGSSSQISRRNLFRMTAGALGSSSSGGKNRNFKILFF